MHSDFYVIRKSGGLVEAVNFNVSKQGTAKVVGKEEWRFTIPTKPKQSAFSTQRVLVIMDANLQNIWVVNPNYNGGRSPGIFCLKAGGIDQPIIDFPIDEKKLNTKDWYFVRGTGEGKSQLYILDSKGNKVREINYSDSGYVPDEYPMRDLIPSHTSDPELNAFKFISLSPDVKFPDCRAQHPDLTTHSVGRFYDSRYSGEEGNIHIGWDFENGFEVEHAPGGSVDWSEEPIDLPGKTQAVWSGGSNEPFLFKNSTQASSFDGDAGEFKVIGILPFGNNAPKPRFPRTMQELDFEKDTKDRLRNLEGQIRELEGKFETLSNRHD